MLQAESKRLSWPPCLTMSYSERASRAHSVSNSHSLTVSQTKTNELGDGSQLWNLRLSSDNLSHSNRRLHVFSMAPSIFKVSMRCAIEDIGASASFLSDWQHVQSLVKFEIEIVGSSRLYNHCTPSAHWHNSWAYTILHCCTYTIVTMALCKLYTYILKFVHVQ